MNQLIVKNNKNEIYYSSTYYGKHNGTHDDHKNRRKIKRKIINCNLSIVFDYYVLCICNKAFSLTKFDVFIHWKRYDSIKYYCVIIQ